MTNDLISRQDAIEALIHEFYSNVDDYISEKQAVHAIDSLPSAQPEIIRCKDCKHVQRWRSEESAKKFGQAYECVRNVIYGPKPDDFCSYGERKTDE